MDSVEKHAPWIARRSGVDIEGDASLSETRIGGVALFDAFRVCTLDLGGIIVDRRLVIGSSKYIGSDGSPIDRILLTDARLGDLKLRWCKAGPALDARVVGEKSSDAQPPTLDLSNARIASSIEFGAQLDVTGLIRATNILVEGDVMIKGAKVTASDTKSRDSGCRNAVAL